MSPIQGQALYKLAFATLNDSTWVLTAIPISTSSQAGDGIICLNDQGQNFGQRVPQFVHYLLHRVGPSNLNSKLRITQNLIFLSG